MQDDGNQPAQSIVAVQPTYWILSLDGGGVRCVLQLALLKRIFDRFPQLEEKIRLVAGTSAGAIVAASIATRGFAQTYQIMMTPTFMEKIFTTSFSHDAFALSGWRSAMFSNAALAAALDEHFGKELLVSSFPRSQKQPHLLIPSFCVDRTQYRQENERCSILTLDTEDDVDDDRDCRGPRRNWSSLPPDEWCPRVYHSFDVKRGHGETPICDALLQSAAAPTYFPIFKGCIDGGVCANAPCLAAFTTAYEYRQFASIESVRMLSVGTGISSSNMNGYGESADLGKLQWVSHLATLMVDSSTEMAVMSCRQLLGARRFHRLQPRLPRYVELYDYAAFADLSKWAADYDLTFTFAWLDHCLNNNAVACHSEASETE